MDSRSPAPGILETVVTDESLLKKDVSTHASHDKDAPALSKSAMKMYLSAKEAAEDRDAKSRRICAAQRAKREGTDLPADPVIREKPVAKAQTSLNDF